LRLVQTAREGLSGSIHELVARLACVPRFLRALNRRMGSPFDSSELADLAQDILCDVWRKLGEYRGIARLETWVFPFVDLGLRGAVRRRARQRRRVCNSLDLEVVADPENTRRAADDAEEREQLVSTFLGRLGEQDRELLQTRYLEDTSVEDLCDRLGLKANAVRNRIHRAILRLREFSKEKQR
jgi:RNA polymerase sigma-70 factor (ECF subfamily)